jgi:hypothetical protein
MILSIHPSTQVFAIVAIQVQLLRSSSMATTASHALLLFSIIFELLGILVAIYFILCCHYSGDSYILQHPPICFMTVIPIILIMMGIIGLTVALVVEMLNPRPLFKLITVVAMISVLIFGITVAFQPIVPRRPWHAKPHLR